MTGLMEGLAVVGLLAAVFGMGVAAGRQQVREQAAAYTPPRSVEAPDLPRPRIDPAPSRIPRPPDVTTYRIPAHRLDDLVCPHCGGVAGRVIAQASNAAPGEGAGVSSRTGRRV